MQQRFLLQILLLAQHVSGTTMPIIRSSRVLHSGCCLWYFVLWFSSCWSGVELRVVSGLQDTAACCKPQLHTRPAIWKPQHQIPHAATTVYTLQLLMMGIVVPETYWATNKICNKNLCCIHLAFYFHISKICPVLTHVGVSNNLE